jgi:hypothetical protein
MDSSEDFGARVADNYRLRQRGSKDLEQTDKLVSIFDETLLNGLSTQDKELIRVLSYKDKNIARML